ncbi:hypothetical protein FRX31_010154 [Thalictrum thalictroides]|uniref:Uncharacterized protein n=1 Tax=Thalictrum thalictroides TaxID=46969 RepID=A0A7J6WSA5_THATH|nr:hypothetical protein FRX31_010154 [Thalictrum thalictroides]
MAKIVSWNARGLCNEAAQESTKTLLRFSKANIILIQEWKVHDREVIDKASMWGSQWKWKWVPSTRLSGGLITAWNEDAVQILDILVGAHAFNFNYVQNN